MADEVKSHEHGEPKVPSEVQSPVETTERGLLDFMGKKEEEKPQEAIASEFEQKVQVSEPEKKDEEEVKKEEEEKKPGLLEKLHRTGSSSSSSSEEEEGEGGEKKKKKKEKGKTKEEGTSVPVEKTQEEKKGFLEKIKEKLPGHGKKQEEHVTSTPPPPPPPSTAGGTTDQLPAEKKGLLDKIKEKLPGYHHSKSAEPQEKKEKESD